MKKISKVIVVITIFVFSSLVFIQQISAFGESGRLSAGQTVSTRHATFTARKLSTFRYTKGTAKVDGCFTASVTRSNGVTRNASGCYYGTRTNEASMDRADYHGYYSVEGQ